MRRAKSVTNFNRRPNEEFNYNIENGNVSVDTGIRNKTTNTSSDVEDVNTTPITPNTTDNSNTQLNRTTFWQAFRKPTDTQVAVTGVVASLFGASSFFFLHFTPDRFLAEVIPVVVTVKYDIAHFLAMIFEGESIMDIEDINISEVTTAEILCSLAVLVGIGLVTYTVAAAARSLYETHLQSQPTQVNTPVNTNNEEEISADIISKELTGDLQSYTEQESSSNSSIGFSFFDASN